MMQDGAVQASHCLARLLGLHAHYHAVGLHEVLDGVTLGQEVGVAGNVKRHIHATLGNLARNHLFHLLSRAHRHCAFKHKHRVTVDSLAKQAGDVQHRGQVGRAVGIEHRVDGTKHIVHVVKALVEVAHEAQAPVVHITGNHIFQAWLIDGNCAINQAVDFLIVGIDTSHIHTEFGKTGSCHQAHISGSYDRDVHNSCIDVILAQKYAIFDKKLRFLEKNTKFALHVSNFIY